MAKESMKAVRLKEQSLLLSMPLKELSLRQKVTMRLCRLYLKMLLLYVCTTVARLQDVRKGMYASSVFLVSNCVKWHLMV